MNLGEGKQPFAPTKGVETGKEFAQTRRVHDYQQLNLQYRGLNR